LTDEEETEFPVCPSQPSLVSPCRKGYTRDHCRVGELIFILHVYDKESINNSVQPNFKQLYYITNILFRRGFTKH